MHYLIVQAISSLMQWPLSRIDWANTNSHRLDIRINYEWPIIGTCPMTVEVRWTGHDLLALLPAHPCLWLNQRPSIPS